MNVGKLIFAIQEKIAAPTTTSLELLMLKKALEKLEVGSVDVIPYYSNLPDATLNTGKLYYVSADEILYWSAGDSWRSIQITSRNFAWSWGFNTSGQLGDNTTVNKSSPVSVVGGFADWQKISSGRKHNVGLRTNSTLWSWGSNASYSLGDSTSVSRSSPVSVVGGFTDWCDISAGSYHNIGIKTNGTAWGWGRNNSAQLGNGTTTTRCSPVSVVGGFTDWCQISGGINHSTGLRTNGTAWAWGCNASGMLGDGTTVCKSSPVSVVGGFSDWCQISTNMCHNLAIRYNRSMWSWGCNTCGVLGDGTTVNKSSPVSVVGGFLDWCQASAGITHSIGLRANGTAWAWGCNSTGQLGNNTIVDRSSPISVVGGFTDWCSISAAFGNTVGLRTNGTAWAWGANVYGRLGDGTTVSRSSPVSVVGGFTDWTQLSMNYQSALGIRAISF